MIRGIGSKILTLVLIAGCPSRRLSGIKVRLYDVRLDPEVVFERAEEALALIQRLDARRFGTLGRYARYIAIAPGEASSIDNFGGVSLSSTMLMEEEAIVAAGMIVHEVTHLRIQQSGIPYTEKWRDRIEILCTTEQADFLRRYPDEGLRLAEQTLELLKDRWWETAKTRQRTREMIANLPLPNWLRRFLDDRLEKET